MRPEDVQQALLAQRDDAYRQGQISLLPTVAPDTILGIRTPALRRMAREMTDAQAFLRCLPHRYFEENQLHAFLLERGRDFDRTVEQVDAFLPFVDNWATCDQCSPRIFRTHRRELLPYIRRWLRSEHPYTVRFGMKMLMDLYLDADFAPEYPKMVASVRHTDYYVKMMAAWYFATALAKQYDAVLPYLAENRLDRWTHNKAIQKAVESRRISPERKELLKQYRRK
ncbi:MAG: DNA alkylation repair protein [Firmicutes bacterium]|nr:DNA alkylation repair protein [Bacillota bacterium]